MAKKVTYDIEFKVGDFVYLVTDPAQYRRMIVGVIFGMEPTIKYLVRFGDYEATEHLPCELCDAPVPDSIREEPDED